MSKLVNIAFQGGTHGNYLRFCIDKFTTLTPDIVGTPFTENNTAHVDLEYSGKVDRYHPTTEAPFFKNTDEPHILITIEKEDLLFIERWVTMRAGDNKVDISKDLVNTHSDFLSHFHWTDKFKKYYNIDLTKNKAPKFILRDFYKLSFLDPEKNGFIEFDKKLKMHQPKNTFQFPVSSFWDKDRFFDTLQQASDSLNLELDISDKTIHNTFLNRLNFFDTKNRANDVIQSIRNSEDCDIKALDIVEQAYVSAWLEENNRFVVVPICNHFFQSTEEIFDWLKHYPQHYKAMNPNLPKFNGIPNPFHLWNLKK
jgi:hypothetical protein